MRIVWDLESDGLLDTLTQIHSLVIKDIDTGIMYSCSNTFYVPESTDIKLLMIEDGLELIQNADEIIGHNIIHFDIPAIQKIYPKFMVKGKIFDTLIASKLVFPDIRILDIKHRRKGTYKLPDELNKKPYSLEAWGYRLKEYKGDYNGGWEKWSPEMQYYCEQDVNVTEKLYNRLQKEKIPYTALELEQQFQQIIDKQINYGVLVDQVKLMDIVSLLEDKKVKLETELKKLFPARLQIETFIPKVNNKSRGYVKGVPFEKRTVIEFKPNSSDDVANRLIQKYGWKPKVLTDGGERGIKKPKVSEEILDGLPYPEIPTLLEYFKVTNALAKLYSGKTSLFSRLSPDGRVRGNVNPFGTGTRRCSHNKPNMTQIPKNHYLSFVKPRECIIPSPGYVLVGCDASGLELRCLCHYMNDIDYTNEVLSGDIHTKNQLAAGLPTRDNAKTFIYGFLYGAGDEKVGNITGKGAAEGKKIKERFLTAIPKLGSLVRAVKNKAKNQGYLTSLDGAKVVIDQVYTALNYLLQGCGAIVMKKALCIFYDDLTAKGWEFGREYAFVLNCHDEIQAEVKPELVEEYKELAVNAIKKAGEFFNFKCPLNGEAKEGLNWAETH